MIKYPSGTTEAWVRNQFNTLLVFMNTQVEAPGMSFEDREIWVEMHKKLEEIKKKFEILKPRIFTQGKG